MYCVGTGRPNEPRFAPSMMCILRPGTIPEAERSHRWNGAPVYRGERRLGAGTAVGASRAEFQRGNNL